MNSRRTFLYQSAAAAALVSAPWVVRAQGAKPVKVGILHPVTGALAYSGQQCRLGALLAIEDINKAGGIKSLGGAPLEAMLGDAQSRPEAGSAEVEKMNEAGVSAIVGAYASAICLATTQTAAKYNLPHVVDVGVADQIVERGLKNTFRFGPGYRACSERAITDLAALNDAAGKPAKTVMIVHEDSLFGTGTAALLSKSLPQHGFEIKDVVKHPNPTRDFNNIVLRMKSLNPDIVIPANYYNEYALLLRHEAAEGAAQGDLFGARGRGLQLQVPEGIPRHRQRHHRLQPLVQSQGRARGPAEGAGRGEGRLFQLRSVHDVHLGAAAGGRPGTRQVRRPRRHHRGAGVQHLLRTTSCPTGRPSS